MNRPVCNPPPELNIPMLSSQPMEMTNYARSSPPVPTTDKELDDLDTRRAYILKHIALNKKALSSAQRLATELIREIILLTVRHSEELLLTKDDPRLSISQICARWREITFGTVEIWDVDLSVCRNQPQESFFKLIGAWFSHCAGNRLSFKVSESYWTKMPSTALSYAVIPNSHHFRQLYLTTDCENIQSILALPSGSFTALEDMVLEANCDYDPFFLPSAGASALTCRSVSPIDAATAFISAPCLRTIQAKIFTRDHRKLQFPWSQLTELTVHSSGVAADVFLVILSGCTSLVRCKIDEISFTTASRVAALSKTPARLPMLKKLHLRLPDSPRVAQFLCSLILPNLCELTLQGGFGTLPGGLIEFGALPKSYIPFFSHFSSTLQVLNLRQGDMASATRHFEWMLKCTPNVKNVILNYGYPLLPSAMEMIANGALLPLVEDIDFESDDPAAMVDMLKSRQSNAQASLAATPGVKSLLLLKKVTIYWLDPQHRYRLTGVTIKAIDDLRSQGLEIIVK